MATKRPQPSKRRNNPPGQSRHKGRKTASSNHDRHLLYGIHSVLEACANPRRNIKKLYVTRNVLHGHAAILKKAACPIETCEPGKISELAPPGAVHQGIVADTPPLPAMAVEDIAGSGIVVVLDQITDPHNVGAILRSSAAFAASAVVITARNSPEAGGVLAKAASGALEHVPLIEAVNLARAIETLQGNGFMCIGFDSEAEYALEDAPIQAPLALVMGAEGKGLRRLTREKCDILIRLDMPGKIKSLNVSNAAALALYATHKLAG